MNSPPTGVPNPPGVAGILAGVIQKDLFRRLEGVVKDREEATPEPQSPEDVEECHQWRCEELRNHFKLEEADKLRMRILQRDYWKLECRHYEDALKEFLWQKACATHGSDGEPTADHWRTLATFYEGLLRRSGASAGQIMKIRHSIDNQKYWQYEAELYQQCVAAHEDAIRQALRKRNKTQRHRGIGSGRSVTKRSQTTHNKGTPDGGVASRTRSRTKSFAGVAKHG